jgi:hypothetical protein
MKQISFFRTILLGLSICSLALVTSCGKEDEDPKPVAEFSYVADGLQVTFTNESENATSYVWDFGDGSATSTVESPTHTYADFGTFTVVLEATGPGGMKSVEYDVELLYEEPIKIDTAFADWTSVPALCSYPDGEGRSLLELKVMDSPNFLYFYVKGTSSLGEVIQLYIDADNDTTTGWQYWGWFKKPGLEYLMEGVMVPFTGADAGSSIQAATGADIDWPWEPLIGANAINKSSGYVESGGNKVVEFSILKTMFTTPELGNTIRILIGNSDNTWANIGTLPPKETNAPPATYTMQP